MAEQENTISLSLKDNVSRSLTGIQTSLSTVRQEAQLLQDELNDLGKINLSFKNIKLEELQRALKETRETFQKLRDQVNETEKDIAETNFKKAVRQYENLCDKMEEAEQAAKNLQKSTESANDTVNSLSGGEKGGTSGGGGASGTLSKLSEADFFKEVGQIASEIGGTVVSSAFGDAAGTMFTSALSTAGTGAAIGTAIAPGVGTAVGAAVGAVVGMVSGNFENFEKQSDAFSDYVKESVETQKELLQENIQAGSGIAASREETQRSVSGLLGSDQEADAYLERMETMSTQGSFSYDELAQYSKSLIPVFGKDQSLSVLDTVSDVSKVMGMDQSDEQTLLSNLATMKKSDQVTQEMLDYFSSRNIDVYEALSELGDADTIKEKIKNQELSGSEVADILLDQMEKTYGTAADQLEDTFQRSMDQLEAAEANAKAAYGEGYNEVRQEGLEEQTEWLNSGMMDEANRAMGAWQAELENYKDQYERDALSSLLDQGIEELPEYFSDEAKERLKEIKEEYYSLGEDDPERGRLLMEAKIMAQNEYNASEGVQMMLESEMSLAEAVREDTETNDAYWDAGYIKGEQYSKGLMNAIGRKREIYVTFSDGDIEGETTHTGNGGKNNAYGLKRVPYDNYLALLHEGERVLTANEARTADRNAARPVTVTFSGPITINQDSDIDTLASRLADAIQLSMKAGVRP